MTNAICNEEIMQKVIEVVESKWSELNETKTIREESKKSKNTGFKLFIQIIITALFTVIYYKIIINPTIEEVVSYINTPSFPLNELLIKLPWGINIYCVIALYNEKENSTIKECPKGQKNINISEVLKKNVILENEGNLRIFFYVADKNYKKIQKEIIYVKNTIYSFDKDNKVVNYSRYKNFHLDSMIKTSNERNVTKYFYYNIQSHRIINEGKVYDFNIIEDSEKIRYFTWESNDYLEYCNFVIYFTKMEYFKVTERKRRSILEIFLVLFGIGDFALKIMIYFFCRKKKENLKNSSNLISNEIIPNREMNIELENQTS